MFFWEWIAFEDCKVKEGCYIYTILYVLLLPVQEDVVYRSSFQIQPLGLLWINDSILSLSISPTHNQKAHTHITLNKKKIASKKGRDAFAFTSEKSVDGYWYYMLNWFSECIEIVIHNNLNNHKIVNFSICYSEKSHNR